MFIAGGIVAIAVGFLCLHDSELAWSLYEMDSRMMGIHVERPKNWRDLVYYVGTTIMFMGAVAVILGFKMIV